MAAGAAGSVRCPRWTGRTLQQAGRRVQHTVRGVPGAQRVAQAQEEDERGVPAQQAWLPQRQLPTAQAG